jgi:hypothetical protein
MLNSWGSSTKHPQGIFLVNMDMNYDCAYSGLGAAFYWMTLDISYLPGINHAPDAPYVPYGPSSGFANNAYTYTTTTTDQDEDRMKYTFNWGDGSSSDTAFTDSGVNASSSHTWKLKGTYEVSARATDEKGLSSNWSESLKVTISPPPSAPLTPSVPVGPTTGYSMGTYSYSTSASDPDKDDVKYVFDWGDGTTSETGFVSSGTAANASHSWPLSRSFYIRAKAIDSRGASSGWSGTKRVRIYANSPPAAPSVPSGPVSGYIKASHSFSTSSTDSNRDNVKYTFDWGDGNSSETGFMASGSKVSASHTWGAIGTYQVRARAMDSKGASSSWSSSVSITITSNRPPDMPTQPSGPKTGRILVSINYSTTAIDPDGEILKFVFDWGDGTTTETNYVASGEGASASHSWRAGGMYNVKVMATDVKGASSMWSNPLAVSISSVRNSPPLRPTPPTGPSKGNIGNNYTYLAYSRDPNGDRIRYIFNWGDGTTSETEFVGSGRSVSASKSWDARGIYYVKVMAEDSEKASSAWSSSAAVRIS